MGGDQGSGSGGGSGAPAALQHLAVPQWYSDGEKQFLKRIGEARTVRERREAMRDHALLGRRLRHDDMKARPPLEPRSLSEATLAQSPADAPLVIAVEPALQKKLDALFQDHLAEGKNERGGTLVWTPSGQWDIANAGASRSGNIFHPNLKVPADHTVVGSFHTHVQRDILSQSPTGLADVAPGGDDIAYMLEKRHDVAIVHAANKEFLLLRTDGTPANVDADAIRREHKQELNAGKMVAGRVYSEEGVTQRLAREYAQKYGLAYYEGDNGTFKRVWPPS
jgi:hypothetical protein